MSTHAISKNQIKIRLTDERWKHMLLMHPTLSEKKELLIETINNPDTLLKGNSGEVLAVSTYLKRTYLVVVYKETGNDGFIITAYETTDVVWLFKKEIIWSKDL